jgi:endonuclease/exonuclease/phosphatase family metal-dependent hydrolase
MKFMSFNIKFNNHADEKNPWVARKPIIAQMIKTIAPDIVGMQEVLSCQRDDLRQSLKEFGCLGNGRDDNASGGEACLILYRRSCLTLVKSGQFWLSETPNAIGSLGWDASYPRIVSWAILNEKQTRQNILCLNTHWDHQGPIARLESARLLRNWLNLHAQDLPTVILGDFNATDSQDCYRLLVNSANPRLIDTHRTMHPVQGPDEGTFHDFTGDRNQERIDWILCCQAWTVNATQIHRTHQNDSYPSDHFPITATLSLNNRPTADAPGDVLANCSESCKTSQV